MVLLDCEQMLLAEPVMYLPVTDPLYDRHVCPQSYYQIANYHAALCVESAVLMTNLDMESDNETAPIIFLQESSI